MRFSLGIAVVLVFFSWTVPALARQFRLLLKQPNPYGNHGKYLKNRWQNAFASLQSSVNIVHDYYGDTVTLGRGAQLRQQSYAFDKTTSWRPDRSAPLLARSGL